MLNSLERVQSPVVQPTLGDARIRVAAVDDDECFRDMLRNELSEQGFEVDLYPDAFAVLEHFHHVAEADVLIIDWSLPKLSGIDMLAQLRRLGVTVPALILTGKPLAMNEAAALDRGAIDYVDKAKGSAVLVRRLRLAVQLKTPEQCREKHFRHGRLTLKPHVSRAFWNDIDLNLTVGEFRIVQLLARNAGRHVSYREIYDCLHYPGFIAGTGDEGYRTNVRSGIRRIRGKFRACDPDFAEIENYTSFGYVWRGADDEQE